MGQSFKIIVQIEHELQPDQIWPGHPAVDDKTWTVEEAVDEMLSAADDGVELYDQWCLQPDHQSKVSVYVEEANPARRKVF